MSFGRKGLSDGSSRVVRGGSWNNNNENNLRVENRNTNDPSNRNNNIGFRVLLGPVAGGG
ncbi:MAG: SUMF1/EgtB/PvdO family nonheme iron enzyme [Opitutales bacterium]|nr:SUMF1/EgtB/PvdO family nonheme iron enzyme [Opitutales bacterium]